MVLKAYYPLDGNANDVRGNNDGTNNGVSWTKGLLGQQVGYADDDYISATGFDFTYSSFTVCAWVKIPDTSTSTAVAGTWDLENDNGGYIFFVENGIATYDHPGDSGGPGYAGGGNFPQGEWTHVVWERVSGNNHRILINGQVVSTDSKSWNPSEDSFQIATRGDRSNNSNLTLAHCRIYNHALTQQEVQYLYQVGSRGLHTSDRRQL